MATAALVYSRYMDLCMAVTKMGRMVGDRLLLRLCTLRPQRRDAKQAAHGQQQAPKQPFPPMANSGKAMSGLLLSRTLR